MGHAPFSLIPLPYVSWFTVRILLSFIHCITCRIAVWLFIPLLLFSIFLFGCIQTVYTTYVHWISLEYYILLEYDILAHVARIFHISTSIHQVYTAYCCNSNIFITGLISCGWYSEVCILISLHFITAWSSPDVYPFYCIYTLYTVYTLHALPLSHWFHVYETYTSAIFTHMLYIIWYTSLYKRYIVYTTPYTPIFPIILSHHTDIHILPGYTTSIQHVYTWFYFQRLYNTTIIHLRPTLSQA